MRFNSGNGYYEILTDDDILKIKHNISFSGGRTSAYLLHKLLDLIPKENIIVNFANTGREDEATLKFIKDNEDYLGMKFNWIEFDLDENDKPTFNIVDYETASRNGEPLYKSIKHSKYVPNVMQRRCTIASKIETMKRYMESLKLGFDNYVTYIGIRYDEPKRWSKELHQFGNNAQIKCYPLVDWKTTKQDVLNYWSKMPFDLQLVEPFGNCDLCMLKSTKRRIAVLKQKPEIAKWWSDIEVEFGNTFDNQYSVKQLYKIATGKALLDENKCQINDIDCNCNID
jgi:3'-phosphoadenosine 5'-phosphosulfate sulfotransferase (PAPS reductase)/FAD synthetase